MFTTSHFRFECAGKEDLYLLFSSLHTLSSLLPSSSGRKSSSRLSSGVYEIGSSWVASKPLPLYIAYAMRNYSSLKVHRKESAALICVLLVSVSVGSLDSWSGEALYMWSNMRNRALRYAPLGESTLGVLSYNWFTDHNVSVASNCYIRYCFILKIELHNHNYNHIDGTPVFQ
jgi:hypothetical protein